MADYFLKNNFQDFMVSDEEFLFCNKRRKKVFVLPRRKPGIIYKLLNQFSKSQLKNKIIKILIIP
jgi:hypothetical protein